MATTTARRSLLLGALLALPGWALGAPSATALLAFTCAGCHGPGGVSRGPAIPTIAGASRDYLATALRDFREGRRPATVMGRIANGFSNEELERLADHFSRRPFVPAPRPAAARQAARGERLHQKYCERCHGEGGRSTEEDAGILAGQWRPYLEYSLKDFLSGEREMPEKMQRRLEALRARHGEGALAALLDFYAAQGAGP